MEWTGVIYVEREKPLPRCKTREGQCLYNPLACGHCEKSKDSTNFGDDNFRRKARIINPHTPDSRF